MESCPKDNVLESSTASTVIFFNDGMVGMFNQFEYYTW